MKREESEAIEKDIQRLESEDIGFIQCPSLLRRINIIKDINSIYMWKGNIENDTEYLLIIKTTEEKSDRLIEKISQIHSYENPECIGVKIDKGSVKYLNWIKEVLT